MSLNPTTPANSSSPSLGAQNMRGIQQDVLTALEKNHYIGDPDSGTGDYDDVSLGEHSKITLREQSSDPANAADKGFLYTKEKDGITELFYEDENGKVLQLTKDGVLGGGSSVKLAAGSTGTDIPEIALTNEDADFGDGDQSGGFKLINKDDNQLMRVIGSHYGTSDDGKGQIELTVNDGVGGTKTLTLTPDGIDAGTAKISNVVDPTANQDAATKKYVDEKVILSATQNTAYSSLLYSECTVDEKSGNTYALEPGETIFILVTGSSDGHGIYSKVALFVNEIVDSVAEEINLDINHFGSNDNHGHQGKCFTLSGVYTNDNALSANVTPRIRRSDSIDYHTVKFTVLKF